MDRENETVEEETAPVTTEGEAKVSRDEENPASEEKGEESATAEEGPSSIDDEDLPDETDVPISDKNLPDSESPSQTVDSSNEAEKPPEENVMLNSPGDAEKDDFEEEEPDLHTDANAEEEKAEASSPKEAITKTTDVPSKDLDEVEEEEEGENEDGDDEDVPTGKDTSETAFESNTEPKPSESPPLMLMEGESKKDEFNVDLVQIPDQILADPEKDDLDERTENDIASNIEDQLREFDGSEDESTLTKDDNEIENSENARQGSSKGDTAKDSNLTETSQDVTVDKGEENQEAKSGKKTSDELDASAKPDSYDQGFEEVDVDMNRKEKSNNFDESDALADDSTQPSATGDDLNTSERTEGGAEKSPVAMDVDETPDEEQRSEKPQTNQDDSVEHAQIEDVDMQSMDEDQMEKQDFGADDPLSKGEDKDDGEKGDPQTSKNDGEKSTETVASVEPMDEDVTETTPATSPKPTEETTPKDGEDVVDEPTSQADVGSKDLEKDPNQSANQAETTVDDSIEVIDDESVSPAEGAVDDFEQGKDADEEICLLPDSEREISDADKERAILAKEAADNATIQESQDTAATEAGEGTQAGTEASDKDKETDSFIVEDDADGDPDGDNSLLEPVDPERFEINEFEIKELVTDSRVEKCLKCRKTKLCRYKLLQNSEVCFLCELKCVHNFRAANKEKYTLIARRIAIFSIIENKQSCVRCKFQKGCRFRYMDQETGIYQYLCDQKCVNLHIGKNGEKFLVRRKKYMVEEVVAEEIKTCVHCSEKKMCKYFFQQDEDVIYICNDVCYNLLSKEEPDRFRIKRRSVRVRDLRTLPASSQLDEPKIVARSEQEAELARLDREASFLRRCAQCMSSIELSERTLQWETIDFCNELCLGKYQNVVGATCTTCYRSVSLPSLGKYCVRFGFEIRQFCCSKCLDSFKKGLKVCSYCQKDISKDKEGFLAPIGDKSQFKDFCSQFCMKHYEDICNPRKKTNNSMCAVCNIEKPVRVEIKLDNREHLFCSNPCFSAFKFVNNIFPDQCTMCMKFFERKSSENYTIYQEKTGRVFCCKICMNIYIILNRKIVPCQWCKVKKYNFDMIQKQCGPGQIMLCSTNCLTLYGVSLNAISMRRQKCDNCNRQTTPQYHLTMSDASVRNFCTYQCVMTFQSQFGRTPLTFDDTATLPDSSSQPVPTGLPKRVKVPPQPEDAKKSGAKGSKSAVVPIISNVQSLAQNSTAKGPASGKKGRGRSKLTAPDTDEDNAKKSTRRSTTGDATSFHDEMMDSNDAFSTQSQSSKSPKRSVGVNTPNPNSKYAGEVKIKTQVVTVPPSPPIMSNKQIMCKPLTTSRGFTVRPHTLDAECQTEGEFGKKCLVPIPVPIYVPQPMYMYSAPFPVPIPIPLPIPIPIFIPTTRNSADGILKEIKKIQDKMPTDPFEAELLMMAEMVAGEKKKSDSDSDSDDDHMNSVTDYVEETVETSNNFGEDVLQMALKMATEYDDTTGAASAVDLESAMTTNTFTQNVSHDDDDTSELHHHQMMMVDPHRHMGGHQIRSKKRAMSPTQVTNRNNRLSTTPPNKRQRRAELQPIVEPEIPKEPAEKPDANMCLKYTFGVNAWKQWVMTKNADLEKSLIRRKPFKSELLQLTADELNYSLCLFVKEVRKPNGSEYAPDTIYYLVLGIQQYLYENGRIDNIFTDPYYERFTDCLDEVARKFSILYNDSQYIVTRVEEEHLWECKQLGAHSPHVLLSTLMFFNTKHFNLTTVEEHTQLSFSHIMKHWKRSPAGTKAAGSRNVLLRFYPPQSGPDSNPRKKKVYEQQENEENPLRCPVKLYEFYLSKCPESVKTRNDVFYLQPERSCVPDSPVWYSTQPLSKEALNKMLHRVKMVKEINIALLTS